MLRPAALLPPDRPPPRRMSFLESFALSSSALVGGGGASSASLAAQPHAAPAAAAPAVSAATPLVGSPQTKRLPAARTSPSYGAVATTAPSAQRTAARAHRFKPFDPGRSATARHSHHGADARHASSGSFHHASAHGDAGLLRGFNPHRQALDSLQRHHYSADQVHDWNIPHYGQVKFTDHCPVAFAAVRDFFGYSLADLEADLQLPLSVNATDGKSDAVFLRSHSGRFLFKSLRGAEPDNLKAFLPSYIPFVLANSDTLLPRYLGMFTLETVNRRASSAISFAASSMSSATSTPGSNPGTPGLAAADRTPNPFLTGFVSQLPTSLQSKCTFLMMPNIFDTPLPVDLKFDFKGSTVGRQAMRRAELLALFEGREEPRRRTSGLFKRRSLKSFDLESRKLHPRDVTLKELDFSRLVGEGHANLIHLGPERREWLIDRLTKDTALLRQHEFMDYSLLIGVHVHKRSATPPEPPPTQHRGSPGHHPRHHPRREYTQPYLAAIQTITNFVRGPTPTPGMMHSASASNSDLASVVVETGEDDDDSVAGESQPLLSDAHDPHHPATSRDRPHREFHGGMRSEGMVAQNIEYEVYFFGLIDALQKYNYFKWVERNLKKQTSQIIHSGPTAAITSIFTRDTTQLIRVTTVPTTPSVLSQSSALSPTASAAVLPGQAGMPPAGDSASAAGTPAAAARSDRTPTHQRTRSMSVHRISSVLTTRMSSTSISPNPPATAISQAAEQGGRDGSQPKLESQPELSESAACSPSALRRVESPLPEDPDQPRTPSPPANSSGGAGTDRTVSPDSSEDSTARTTPSPERNEGGSTSPPPLPPTPTMQQASLFSPFSSGQIPARQIMLSPAPLAQLPENSVEEPVRYAARLVEFIAGIVV
nr:Phosphatidylinositol 5-phosphate 4-kinase type-2 alpha [Polyrhizophydium stewartii]